MSARELWRPCSRRTGRSRRSTSDVRSSVLAVAGEGGGGGGGGGLARSHGRRPRAGARCRVSSRLQLGGTLAASGPLGGCVAPPCRRDACRVGWVLCTPQGIASAPTARELWRPHSRRTGHSRRSASKVRSSVLVMAGEGGGGACGAVSRPAAARGRTMQSELALAVGRRARAASGPLGGRVAPPLAGVTLLPCELGAVHAADNKIGNDGARALAASLEKNRTLTMLGLEGAQLCASDGWGGGACGAVSRPAAARGRTMQSELALAVGRRARAASGPLGGRVAPPLAGVTLLPCELGAVHGAGNKISFEDVKALEALLKVPLRAKKAADKAAADKAAAAKAASDNATEFQFLAVCESV